MAHMAISQVREQLPSVIELAQSEAVIIERHGTPQAVIISYERYDELMTALEDIEDLAALKADPPDPNDFIPWEDIKRDLGL